MLFVLMFFLFNSIKKNIQPNSIQLVNYYVSLLLCFLTDFVCDFMGFIINGIGQFAY